MMLTCEKCGRKHPLTDDDIVAFHPRFFCLSCGAKLPFAIDAVRLAQLQADNDRSRRLASLKGLESPDTIRHVRPAGGDSVGTSGG